MPQTNLDEVLAAMAQLSATQVTALKQGAAENFAAGAAVKAAPAPTADASYNTVVSMAEDLKRAADAENETYAMAAALGLRGSDALTVRMGQEMRQSFEEATALSSQIDQIESQSFFDNPLGWISNKLVGGEVYNKYNAAANKFNAIQKGMTALNTQAQQTAATLKTALPGLSIEAQKSKIEALNNKLSTMHTELAVAAHQHNAEAYNKLAQAAGAEYQALVHNQSMFYEDARLKLSEASANLKAITAQEKAIADEEGMYVAAYQLAHRSWFGVDAPEVSAKLLMSQYKKNPRVTALIDHGLALQAIPADSEMDGSFGATPAAAHQNIELASIPLTPAAKQAYDTLIFPHVLKLATDPDLQKTLKTPQDRETYLNAAVIQTVKGYTSNLDSADKTNPFLIQPLATIAQDTENSHKVIKNTQLWKTVFAPAVAQGKLKELNHQEMFNLVAAGIEQKLVKPDVAAKELADIVAYSSYMNGTAKQFRRFGLPEFSDLPYIVKLQIADYKVNPFSMATMDMTSSWKDYDLVNLKNINDIKRALLKATTVKAKLQSALGFEVIQGERKLNLKGEVK